MRLNPESFVGSLAIAMASLVVWNALSFSSSLYRLTSVAAVRSRFGNRAACGLLLAVAALLFGSGIMILSGARPAYAISAPADAD
jgi:hypothetical protein